MLYRTTIDAGLSLEIVHMVIDLAMVLDQSEPTEDPKCHSGSRSSRQYSFQGSLDPDILKRMRLRLQ